MFKYLFLFILVACKSTPVPQTPTKSPTETCTMVYDPHLCIITIDSTTFTGHGSNKCIALKKLRNSLLEKNHNPLILVRAECGRVFN
jgi:hypothetical protein